MESGLSRGGFAQKFQKKKGVIGHLYKAGGDPKRSAGSGRRGILVSGGRDGGGGDNGKFWPKKHMFTKEKPREGNGGPLLTGHR